MNKLQYSIDLHCVILFYKILFATNMANEYGYCPHFEDRANMSHIVYHE